MIIDTGTLTMISELKRFFQILILEKGFLAFQRSLEIICISLIDRISGRLPNKLADKTRCYIINYAHPPRRQKGKLGDPV